MHGVKLLKNETVRLRILNNNNYYYYVAIKCMQIIYTNTMRIICDAWIRNSNNNNNNKENEEKRNANITKKLINS